jgi:hypothetical protein
VRHGAKVRASAGRTAERVEGSRGASPDALGHGVDAVMRGNHEALGGRWA